MTIDVEIETDAQRDVLQLVRNGIEQERRRPKFSGGATNSARRIARLTRAVESLRLACERSGA